MKTDSDNSSSLKDLKKDSGYYISRCKLGHGIQLKLPNGEVFYFNLIKLNADSAEIALKVPKSVQIKKID